MFLQAVQSVASLLAMMAVGYVLAGREWFAAGGVDLFSKFLARVAIPCYMFCNVLDFCGTKEQLLRLGKNLPIPIAVTLAGLVLGWVLARLLRVGARHRGVFINAVAFSNTVFIGFPVIRSLYGDIAAPDGMIYYMANTLFFWTVGTYLLRRDSGQHVKFFSVQNVKEFFSPAMLGMLAGIAAVLLNLSLPQFVMFPLEGFSSTTTPLAMVFIGSVVRLTDFKKVRMTRDLAVVLLARFVITPAFVALLLAALPIETLMKQVFFVLAIMPAMTQLGIMAKESGSDYEFASVLVAVTSALSMITLPVYVSLISTFRIFG